VIAEASSSPVKEDRTPRDTARSKDAACASLIPDGIPEGAYIPQDQASEK